MLTKLGPHGGDPQQPCCLLDNTLGRSHFSVTDQANPTHGMAVLKRLKVYIVNSLRYSRREESGVKTRRGGGSCPQGTAHALSYCATPHVATWSAAVRHDVRLLRAARSRRLPLALLLPPRPLLGLGGSAK